MGCDCQSDFCIYIIEKFGSKEHGIQGMWKISYYKSLCFGQGRKFQKEAAHCCNLFAAEVSSSESLVLNS